MPYELFKLHPKRKNGPTVTIRADGRLRLSADATRILLAANVSRVGILWDQAKQQIALRGAACDDGAAFRLSVSAGGASADIAARKFLDYIGYDLSGGPLDVPLVWDAETKMFEGPVSRKPPTSERPPKAPAKRRQSGD